jgi:hypothetical protein
MATPATTTPSVSATQAIATSEVFPSMQTMLQATKIAIEQDKAIMLDYYRQTVNNTAFLADDPETKERILIKSKDEFTSLIKKVYKVENDFIITTENSVYIVSSKIQKRKVNLAALYEAAELS